MTMRKRKKRLTSNDRIKPQKIYVPPTNKERFIIIGISLLFIVLSLYSVIKNNFFQNNELATVTVTLKAKPLYDEFRIKSTTYKEIVLKTNEYKREFRIQGMTFEATNFSKLMSTVHAGDKVEIEVLKRDSDNLNNNSYWNNYNVVYGLTKDNVFYIDTEQNKELNAKDSVWALGLTLLGFIILPYGFMKKKPVIGLDKAITLTAIFGLIVYFLIKMINK